MSNVELDTTPPPSQVADDPTRPIGVERGYVAPGRATRRSSRQNDQLYNDNRSGYTARQSDMRGVPARFFGGQERTILAGMGAERLGSIQREMLRIGLFKESQFSYGTLDDGTAAAFREVLAYANAAGFDNPFDAMARMAADYDRFGFENAEKDAAGGPKGRAPLTVQVTDPADLRRVFRNTVQQLTGRIDDDYVETLVGAYQARESGAQSQAYGMAETGGTLTAPPSPQGFAEEQTREDFATEVGATEIEGQFQNLLGIIGGLGNG